MIFWLAVAGWVVATLVLMVALSINGVTEPPAGGGHGHGNDDHGHGAQGHGGGHH
jgi:hypothetical protein